MILSKSKHPLVLYLFTAMFFGCSGPTLKTSPATWDEIEGEIAQHKGKVVVVDLWSNYCPPCMREFPNLVDLQSDHRDDVTCISVNLNYTGAEDDSVEDKQKEADAFLNKINGQETNKVGLVKNFISEDSDETVLSKVNSYALPTVIVYDKTGKVAKVFPDGDTSEFTYEADVLPFVHSLLANQTTKNTSNGTPETDE